MAQRAAGFAATDLRVARIAGGLLIAAPLLQVLGMAHHPSVQAHEAAAVLAQLRASARLSAAVHGMLIALMFAVLLALTEFSVARGLSRPAVRAGLITYGAGVLAMTAAALVSGFITPRLALLNPAAAAADPALTVQLAGFAMLLNQAFAKCGAVLMSAGIAAWSLELTRAAGPAWAVGVFGLVTGLGGALALCAGLLPLNVHGMRLVTVLQAAWAVGAGWVLLAGVRGRGVGA